MTVSRRRRWLPRLFMIAVAVIAVGAAAGTTALYFDLFGLRERAGNFAERIELMIDPPPDRPIEAEVLVTPKPTATATPVPTATPTLAPGETPAPTPAPTPTPKREPVDVDVVARPKQAFITQTDNEWCAVAATQMVLGFHDAAPLSEGFQRELAGRIEEWESRRDSKNGGWGPASMVAALEAYGVTGYEVRAYANRQDAMADSARAIQATGAPVILIAWRGAHAWVMTGFRADADPTLFEDAHIEGTYILDPWYPRNSTLWGQSDPPGTFQDLPEMRRNYLPWKRPEGIYPQRDGLFLAVVPTEPVTP